MLRQQDTVIDVEARTVIAVQLACSSLVAGASGLLLFHWLHALRLAPVLVVLLALLGSVSVGLLATANMQASLFLLSLTLKRLAEGKSLNLPQAYRVWPLGTFFRSLAQIHAKIDMLCQHERLTNEYHAQLLQQASEAAAVEERNRLARDLHDSIKQQIFSIRMSATAVKAHIQTGMVKAQEALEDILRSSDEAQVEMQALLQQLRSAPLEHTSLAEAVRTQARALEYRSGAQVSIEMTALPTSERCPLPTQEVLFRIVQEAFANIARHARAQHVAYIQTQDEEMLFVTIRDDGQGFDRQTAHTGMGLTNIQERAQSLDGKARIESEPGRGTTLHIQIPLLLSPEIKEQQEQKEYAVQRMIEQAQGGLQLRSISAVLTMVTLTTTLGLFGIRASMVVENFFIAMLGICLFLMLYGLVTAHLAVARIQHHQSAENRSFYALTLHLHASRASFFRLFLFASWQILAWGLFLRLTIPPWGLKLALLLLAGSIVTLLWLESRKGKQAQDRYYPLLPPVLLKWEIRLKWRDIRLRIILCLCAGVILLVSKPLSFFVPVTPWQWLQDYLLLAFFVLCLGIVIDMRRLKPWNTLAKATR